MLKTIASSLLSMHNADVMLPHWPNSGLGLTGQGEAEP
jgi:hypothetical protein